MICPKCKKQIPERSLKCNHCGARIATFCKKCNAYNPISNLTCVKCKNELLKVCPSCKSINLPNVPRCRKCGFSFLAKTKLEPQNQAMTKPNSEIQEHSIQEKDQSQGQTLEQNQNQAPVQEQLQEQITAKSTTEPSEQIQEPVQPEPILSEEQELDLNYAKNLSTQQFAKDSLVKGLMTDAKKVISVSGKNGLGKTIVLKAAIQELKKSGATWMFGECNSTTQLSPCGLIQDILLTFFNIPNFSTDNLKLKKDSQRFFHSEFPSLTNEEIFSLLNFLYPTNSDYFENILNNKVKTFTFLQKVFNTIIENNETVIVIENFDYIDGFSYEFLHNLLNSELMKKQLKFLITYDELRPARGYLYNNDLNDEAYLDISLGAFDRTQTNSMIDSLIKLHLPKQECPESLKAEIFNLSNGNPAVIEQYVSLIIDFGLRNNSFKITLPDTFENLLRMRLEFLKENDIAYKVLSLAAIQGIKFSHLIINQVLKIEENKYIEILNLLQLLNFIAPVSPNFFAFKNSLLWTTVFEVIKQSEDFLLYNNVLFEAYSAFTLSSHSNIAIIAQNLNRDLDSLRLWTENIKLSAYIGDKNLYAISQKQCLIIVNKLEQAGDSSINFALIKNNIYERLGKLLTKTNPQEAVEYLPNAILNAQNHDNVYKEIELTGYLANCCMNLGNYYGTIECVNSVINKVDESFDLEIAMLKSRKLDALLNIGNCGEIINLIDNEILPVFDKYINSKPHKNISIKSLYKSWLQTYLSLANALVFQGNNRSFEVISTLFEIIEKNNFDDQLFICKAKLTLAFAHTIKGDIEVSENILGEILRDYKTDIMDNEAISRWNLINIFNNFAHKKYTGLKEELFQVVTFANNINDNLTKNILKTLLGKILKDEENAKRALDIYMEQITYFSKEKNAIGALLNWYLIAEAKLITDGPEQSLEVAQKALDVAQSAKISNYLFIALYCKIIAEAYMVLADYESAKVYIEKAIMISRKFELLDLLAKLYLLYGKYLQDIALAKTDAQVEYVSGAARMYKKASLISKRIKNNYLITTIEKYKNALNSFCQLNKIVLHEK